MSRVALAFAPWLCAAMAAFAQNPGNLPIVGVLRLNTADTVEPTATGFKEALAALGLVDGRNIRLEVRLADGHAERLPDLAQSLVQAKASVIVVFGAPAIRAVQRATSTIPIVAFGELLSEGLIGSLARPGGNTTGVSILNTELDAKRLEVLKQIVPSGRRFALLRDPAFSFPAQMQAIIDVGHALGVELQVIDVRGPADLAPAFAAFRVSGAEAINVVNSPMFLGARAEVGRLSLTTSFRRSANGARWPRSAVWRAMAPDYRKAGPCLPP
jgi:putative ABC transport system substrate-binding protein